MKSEDLVQMADGTWVHTVVVGYLAGHLVESETGAGLLLAADKTAVISHLTDGAVLITPALLNLPKFNEHLISRMRATPQRGPVPTRKARS